MYPTMVLADFVEINPRVTLKPGQEYSFVDMASVTPGRRYVSAEARKVYQGGGSKFQVDDVLFARITPCLENGKIAQYVSKTGEVGFGSTEFFVLRHRQGVSDSAYVYYLAYTDIVRKPAEKSMSGASGRQRADLEVFKSVEVPTPPLPTQRKIAAILSAYDDLIENNTRRIVLLEQMAQLLYREWFVRFRFPGHESAPRVASELGEIPEGWEVVKLTQAVYVNPSTRIPREGQKPFVPMSNLSNGSMLITKYELREGNSGAKFKNGDTLFARITPCLENGKTGYVQFLPSEDAVAFGSTEFIVLRSKTLSPEYVYLLARSEDLRAHAIKSMTGATGRQRVQESCFENFLVVQPPAPVLNEFTTLIKPMFYAIWLLAQKNVNLRRTRDLLLPRLISGEVDVAGAAIAGIE